MDDYFVFIIFTLTAYSHKVCIPKCYLLFLYKLQKKRMEVLILE